MKEKVMELMKARFQKGCLIAMATSRQNIPSVRAVNAYYLDGAFYIITDARSGKMQDVAVNPNVALCGQEFNGHGVAENLGHVLLPENMELMAVLRDALSEWYDYGHVDETDVNTILLRIRMKDGVLMDGEAGVKYEIDFF